MARAQFYETVFSNAGVPINGAQITVKDVDSNGVQGANSTVYSSETGASKANPFLTGSDGYFDFWVPAGTRYNVIIEASGQTTKTLRFDPGYWPPPDHSIGRKHLDDTVISLGDVRLWWRPIGRGVTPNFGSAWVEIKGQTLGPTEHDFPGGGTLTLPNIRNAFLTAASLDTADGVDGGATNDSAGASGIGAIIGQNLRDLLHTHVGADHYHTVPDHSHFVPDHYHGFYVPYHQHIAYVQGIASSGGGSTYAWKTATNGVTEGLKDAAAGSTGNRLGWNGWTNGSGNINSWGPSARTTDNGTLTGKDLRPRGFALAAFVLVKNS